MIQLVCYRVLAQAGDERRAAAVLGAAYEALQVVAATITDLSLRQGYLKNIPEHREIATAWAVSQKATSEPVR